MLQTREAVLGPWSENRIPHVFTCARSNKCQIIKTWQCQISKSFFFFFLMARILAILNVNSSEESKRMLPSETDLPQETAGEKSSMVPTVLCEPQDNLH